MNIDKTTIERIAHLSRLDFDEQHETKMLSSLNNILEWVKMLNQIDTSGVEPLTQMSMEVNILRNDDVQEPLPHDKALANAPKKDSNYFRVPKVIE